MQNIYIVRTPKAPKRYGTLDSPEPTTAPETPTTTTRRATKTAKTPAANGAVESTTPRVLRSRATRA